MRRIAEQDSHDNPAGVRRSLVRIRVSCQIPSTVRPRIRGRWRFPRGSRPRPPRCCLPRARSHRQGSSIAGVSGDAGRIPRGSGRQPTIRHTQTYRTRPRRLRRRAHGSEEREFRSQALQNVALLFNEMFMRLTPHPPLFLHAPGEIRKAEDDLSRAVAADLRACESTSELCTIAVKEASKLEEARGALLHRPLRYRRQCHRSPVLRTSCRVSPTARRVKARLRSRTGDVRCALTVALRLDSPGVCLCLPASAAPRQDRRQGKGQ